MRRARPEDQIHKACMEYLQRFLPHGWMPWHPRNGGALKGENGRAKALGVIAGMPDIIIFGRKLTDERPDGYPVAYFVEVKTPTGRLSPDQRAVHDRLIDQGWKVAVVRSLDDMRRAAWNWNLPVHDATLERDMTGRAR